jgi:hypothetical protein
VKTIYLLLRAVLVLIVGVGGVALLATVCRSGVEISFESSTKCGDLILMRHYQSTRQGILGSSALFHTRIVMWSPESCSFLVGCGESTGMLTYLYNGRAPPPGRSHYEYR